MSLPDNCVRLVPVAFSPDLTNEPAEWRKWAAELRAIAAAFKDGEAKRRMIAVAETYEQLADREEGKDGR
jgi:hypothetical protein